MQKIIIDGYNLIHADESMRRLLKTGIESARDALIDRVREYVASRNVLVTVVFDGTGGITDTEPVIAGRLQLLFTAGGQTADALIVETIETHPNPREFIVVTSDMADIGRRARAAGATVMSSPDFLQRIAGGKAAGAKGADNDDADVDMDYWLDAFEGKRTEDAD